MKRRLYCAVLALVLCACLVPSFACAQTTSAQQAPALQGARGEFLATFNADEKKYVSLGEKMPAEKWVWRPGESYQMPGAPVRNLGEVYLHVAASNFGYASSLGGSVPAGIDVRKLEQSTTDKAKILDILKQSFASVREAVEKLPADSESQTTKMYGREVTYRRVYMAACDHLGEHLGQSIAYARANGIIPPWSERPAAKKQ